MPSITMVPAQYANISQPRLAPAYLSIPARYEAGWSMCISTLKSGFLSRADQMFISLVREQFGDQADGGK
ncbi:MAG: hypothetical protein LUH04_16315 [Clostridium sp.]|nr:hypothetical protein [Clostridium sp.]